MHSITFRLLTGFFVIILIFGFVGLDITRTVSTTSEESRQFVEEYWPTANLIIEAQLSKAKLTTLAFSPPAGNEGEVVLASAHEEIERLHGDFSQTPLEAAELLRLDPLFEQLSQNIMAPTRKFSAPGDQVAVLQEEMQVFKTEALLV